MADYAIGDIQGCFQELQQLLVQCAFNPQQDTLWLAGDLVNRGPDSLSTLRFIHQLGPAARVVLGNHDLHLLAVYYGHSQCKRSDTLAEILAAPDGEALMTWLRQQPLLQQHSQLPYAMLHAGLHPHWSLAQAQQLSDEVQQILSGEDYDHFFRHMYGDQPAHWSDQLQGPTRWRVITNYFTRMRICTPAGQLDLKYKQAPGAEPQGFMPWYAVPGRRSADRTLLFGHWASLAGKADGYNVFALDTGCVWGGSLTALRLQDQKLFSVRSSKN